VVAAPPKQALSRLLDATSLSEEGDWLTLRLRDPLAAPRPALTVLVQSAVANHGQPRAQAVLDYLRECPSGISGSLAGCLWNYIGPQTLDSPITAALLHLVAACGREDLQILEGGVRVSATQLSPPAREALERLLFRHPLVRFETSRRTPQGLEAVPFAERCEPTYRIPGPLTRGVTLRLRTVTTDFATVDNYGVRQTLSPQAIAELVRRQDTPNFNRFNPGVQYVFNLEVTIDGDTTFTTQASLSDLDLQTPPIPYARLSASLRRQVEDQLKD
jgi:hypothetical protein